MTISIDTETTGFNLHHNDRPYFVTICDENMDVHYWEWDVCPRTRHVKSNRDDIAEIIEMISGADRVVLQNAKFDAHALTSLFREYDEFRDWQFPWEILEDTLIASHVLQSNGKHDLTALAILYADARIEPYEEELAIAAKAARDRVRRGHINRLKSKISWNIKGLDANDPIDNPTKGGTAWKADMWLPRAYAKYIMGRGELTLSETEKALMEKWLTVLSDYANLDSSVTMAVWQKQEELLHEHDLWAIYRERMKLPKVAFKMENRGVSASRSRVQKLRLDYAIESNDQGKEMQRIAKVCGVSLTLPKKGINDSLRAMMFGRLKLPVMKRTPKGAPSLDADAMVGYSLMQQEELDACHPLAGAFVKALSKKNSTDTACGYLDQYTRQWKSDPRAETPWEQQDAKVIHPSLNITGTNTLRWSCSGFNEQNISKKAEHNLRQCFGPAEGREWWSLDAQNIELRIPAFAAEQRELVDVFLRPKEGPYYGSYHLVVFDALYPALFKQHGKAVKDLYEDTLYQWVKNGNFALIYGAQEDTADRTYRFPGAYRLFQSRFPKIAELSARMIATANRRGFIETIPDQHVSPTRGYPIYCSHGGRRISPTVPLNYFVQSTAMWWTSVAMARCNERLEQWNREGFDGFITMQVHDEMVFDFPRAANPMTDFKNSNLWRIKEMQRLMELGGEGIGIPTPVAIEYNTEDWSKNEKHVAW